MFSNCFARRLTSSCAHNEALLLTRYVHIMPGTTCSIRSQARKDQPHPGLVVALARGKTMIPLSPQGRPLRYNILESV